MTTTTQSRTATEEMQLSLDFFATVEASPKAKATEEPKTRKGRGELLFSQGAVEVIEEFPVKIHADGQVVQQRIERGRYQVAGSQGKSYTVTVRGMGREYRCECPAITFAEVTICKHIHAVAKHIGDTNQISLHTHDLRRFEGMLENPQPHGLSATFIERAASAARRQLRALGVEPVEPAPVEEVEPVNSLAEYADLFA